MTVRFSDSTGLPNIPDGSPNASPHGIAIKYHLPGGSETDMVLNSLKFFPVATGADFRDLLLAIAASPTDAPKPTKFELFVKAHPAVPMAFATVATPDSFADEEYNGVDAFIFVDKAGKKQPVRYLMEPEKLVHLSEDEAAKKVAEFPDGRTSAAPRAGACRLPSRGAARAAGRLDQGSDASHGRPTGRSSISAC